MKKTRGPPVFLGDARRAMSSFALTGAPDANADQKLSSPIFTYTTKDFCYDIHNVNCNNQNESAVDPEHDFHTLLMKRWEESKQHKSMNYDLNCMYKLLPGDYNLSIQLNVERGQLRRKPMHFRNIEEPFNNLRWNFTKIKQSEILMYLRCADKPLTSDSLDRHLLIVNASPLERGHSLVVPCVNKCLPQVLNEVSVKQSTDLMLLTRDDSFHILFNSLLGHASVNHLHVHALFWPYDSDLINRRFEMVQTDLYVIRQPDWFMPAFAFQLTGPDDLDSFNRRVSMCTQFLTKRNVAHNVFFTRAQPLRTDGPLYSEDRFRKLPSLVTVYIFPRRSVAGAKPSTNFSPASCELGGCLTSYTWRFFESVTELSALRVIEEEAALPTGQFEELVTGLLNKMRGIEEEPMEVQSAEDLTSPELDELHDSFQTFSSPKRRPIKQSSLSLPRFGRPRAVSTEAMLEEH